jgi:HAD superfamily hydrolase (TIGR01484 family)
MQKLLFLDIDGCIMPPNRDEVDLDKLSLLRENISKLSKDISISIFTGRSQEYVEFLSQVLGLIHRKNDIPFVIENGSALYYPKEKRTKPIINNTKKIQKIKELLYAELPNNPFEPKSYIITINPKENETIEKLKNKILSILDKNGMLEYVEVTNSASSVDILQKGINKLYGVKYVIKHYFDTKPFIVAMGDSTTDKDVLLFADNAYVPQNASNQLKQIVFEQFGKDALLDKEHIDAVIHMLELF